ncbi:LamG domain-containing protein [Polyangium aurulentum]|uniref:LamG domain-containing protein n=1 Tax=Polyangium aurulentum TaxID=2567896 RepID=UPI00146DE198|nr:LamG domain-containing protein [Polyangium aurulentum]UQA63008.1 LamG domain-containing protein [Polyangium aurulentum]
MKRAILAASLVALLSGGCSVLVDLEGLSDSGGGGAGASGPGGGPGAFTFTDDALEGEFGLGTNTATEWAGDRVVLDGTLAEGVFRSRIFDAGAEATWETFTWTPAAPYQKPLPGEQLMETSYQEDAFDMDSNILLYHLDGTGQLSNGAMLFDSSGDENHAAVRASGTLMQYEQGSPIGAALRDGTDTYAALEAEWVETWSDDFTWALWVKTTQSCAGNKVYLGSEDGSMGPHVWLGCADGVSLDDCGGGVGRAAGVLLSDHTLSGDGTAFCGTTQINDGAWHHLAVVKEDHDQATVTLYVDGEAEDTHDAFFSEPLNFTLDPEFGLGAFVDGDYQAEGSFDEVAMWDRALSADEIAALWRRGALRLSLAVRTCNDPACSDNPPFVGPNGSAEGYTDSEPTLTPPGDLPLSLPKGRYFQYEARMSTYRVGESPALLSVTVKGHR